MSHVKRAGRWRNLDCVTPAGDLFAYQQLIWQRRPGVVLWLGPCGDGDASFLVASMPDDAMLMACVGHYREPYVDGRLRMLPLMPGDPSSVGQVRAALELKSPFELLVVEAQRSLDVVSDVLDCYSGLVAPGGFYVVQHDDGERAGVADEVERWLGKHPDWWADRSAEPPGTISPGAFLRRLGRADDGGKEEKAKGRKTAATAGRPGFGFG